MTELIGRGIYKCWIPDRGHTVDDARQIERLGYHEAAQYYAEHYCGFQGDPFSEITVRVRCERFEREGQWIASGFEWDIVIDVVPMPVFEVGKVKQLGVVKHEDWRDDKLEAL